MQAVAAALWLLGLFAAAPLLRANARTYGFADRLRDALVLGVAIPFALGLLHLLYPAALWIVLVACVSLAFVIPSEVEGSSRTSSPIAYLTIAAIAIVAWPQLMRPLLDGDSVSYHLPIAASFAHAHSVWTADARYWWYPPASELFASGLFSVSGPFATGWSGLAAIALLALRISQWAREAYGASPLLADALAAATVTAAPIALQAGTMQNDVWLAAFLVESLWAMRTGNDAASARALAVTALIKPYGWLLAFGAALAGKATLRACLVASGAFALWVLHDALLWHAAVVAPLGTTYYNGVDSTIAGHGASGLELLGWVALRVSPFVLLTLLIAALGPFVAERERRGIGWLALATVLLYVAMPWGYADAQPQLATGASLRYAAPAIALGAVLLARVARRAPALATLALIASTAFGAYAITNTFWNDAPARLAIVLAVMAISLVAWTRAARSPWPIATGFAAAVVAASLLAARFPAAYYADALRVDGRSTGLYAWLASQPLSAVGGWGLRSGTVNVLLPNARTVDLPDAAPCEAARREGVVLVAVSESGRSAANAARLQAARACGRVGYDDGIAVVTLVKGSP